MLEDVLRGSAILRLVKRVAEALTGLSDLLLNLLVVLGQLVLDEDVGAIALLRVAVVDKGVVECIHMARGLPNGGVHEDGGIDAHDVVVQQHHALPPIALYIVLQFDAHLAVVIDSAQSVVDLAGGKNESILFAMRYDFLENIFLLCHFSSFLKFWSAK